MAKEPSLKSPDEMAPHLDIPATMLPHVKEWKVGSKYRVILEVEQTGIRNGYSGEGPIRAEFKVLSAKSAGEVKDSKEGEKPAPSRTDKLEAIKGKARKY